MHRNKEFCTPLLTKSKKKKKNKRKKKRGEDGRGTLVY